MAIDQDWVEKIAPEDQETVQQILTAFSNPTIERSELDRLANAPQTLALEKKYVPQLKQNRLPLMNCEVLVCPVGFRPAPVLLIILILKPKMVYLLHSSDSRRYAEMIRDDPDIQHLGLSPDQDVHLKEISLTNAPDNYEVIRTIVQQSPKQQVVVDITGGVKVMGVSLAAAAFWQRLPVIYLLGEEIKGIIKPFTEQLYLLQNPYDHFGDTEFKLLKGFFDSHNYDAALNICTSLRDSVGDVSTLGKLDILAEFIQVYRDWDAFSHSGWEAHENRKLATRLRVLIGKMNRFGLSLADPARLQGNLAFLEKIETLWQPNQRNLADPYRLIDIFCAAQRRAKAGKYDDAVARLYRCLEMSATILLVEDWEILTPKKPNLQKLAAAIGGEEQLQEKFRQLAQYELPAGGLGLNDQMSLLMAGDLKKHKQLTGIYTGMKNGDLIEHRNRSTLAHGTVPVSEPIYQQFCQKTKTILSWVVGQEDLTSLLQQATHPELTLKTD